MMFSCLAPHRLQYFVWKERNVRRAELNETERERPDANSGKGKSEQDTPEVPQQLDLPERPLAEHGVIERGDALDRDFRTGGDVHGRTVASNETTSQQITEGDGRGARRNDKREENLRSGELQAG